MSRRLASVKIIDGSVASFASDTEAAKDGLPGTLPAGQRIFLNFLICHQ
jgi:hypothetical protein